MNKVFGTNSTNISALIARISLGIVVFPHGAQKLLGWFGGYGFSGTMNFFTSAKGLPYIVALLVILIEFFGALMLIVGFATRVAALGIIGLFAGIIASSNFNFFMNWQSKAGEAEGLEFFILLFGLAIISLMAGGGKASLDAAIFKNSSTN